MGFILFASCCIQIIPCAVSLCCLPGKRWCGHLPRSLPQLSVGHLFSPGGGLLPRVPGWPWGWECDQSHRGMHTGYPFGGRREQGNQYKKNRYNSEVESPGTRTYVNTGRSTACSKALAHKTCRLHAARYRPTERQNKSSPHTASILPSYVRLLKINSTALCKNSQPSVPASSLPA